MLVQNKIDILVITETKLDDSFPVSQFLIDGFHTPYRFDRKRGAGGVMIYVSKDITSKQLYKHSFADDIEGIFIEINLRKCKWLLFGTYHPPSQPDSYYFENVSSALDIYTKFYNKILLIGDFNAEDSEPCLSDFLYKHECKNLVKDKTCFKSIENPSCIDLFLTNSQYSFQNTFAVATGFSDFHKMVLTVLKVKIDKQKSKKMTYRDYKKFDESNFKKDLAIKLGKSSTTCESFENNFLEVLENHAPEKSKYNRANQVPYMTKSLRKAIMKRSELQSKFFKNRSHQNMINYKKQRNFCSRLNKKEKKNYYSKLDTKQITENKAFWKTMKPLFSVKGCSRSKITLTGDGKIIKEDQKISDLFSTYFKEAVDEIVLQSDENIIENVYSNVSTNSYIKRYKYHPSILSIQKKIGFVEEFNFSNVTVEEIDKELNNLNEKKACSSSGIPTKVLKKTSNICNKELLKIWNEEIVGNKNFPKNLKLAEISPIFKKGDKTVAKNYRPISVLPCLSKLFERILQTQLLKHIEKYLSPFMCGYRKGFSAQFALISLIEHCKKILDKNGFAGAVLMDLSKAFDTIDHKLLLAKLNAYGLGKDALLLIESYLSDRWQKVKVNSTFSSWTELTKGVPQGSVLGPLLFNIYLNDLFFELDDSVCNFADDTTSFVCDKSLEAVLHKLENNTDNAIQWFQNNQMKMNPDKCNLLIAGHKWEHAWATVGDTKIWENDRVKLLGVTIDNKLRFDTHLSEVCRKAENKLSALTRIFRFLSFDKRRLLVKAFFESQFKYCSLVWMFCSRTANNKINSLHKRALRLIYEDYDATFEELLEIDGSFSVHHFNIQTLLIEIYKFCNGLSIQIFRDLFQIRNNRYCLRSNSYLQRTNVQSVYNGENSLSNYAPKMWDLVPMEIKNSASLEIFIRKIRHWKPQCCPCRLCKVFIPNLGFI